VWGISKLRLPENRSEHGSFRNLQRVERDSSINDWLVSLPDRFSSRQ
jgi:hypothetical protein